jgi:hypothetical protein
MSDRTVVYGGIRLNDDQLRDLQENVETRLQRWTSARNWTIFLALLGAGIAIAGGATWNRHWTAKLAFGTGLGLLAINICGCRLAQKRENPLRNELRSLDASRSLLAPEAQLHKALSATQPVQSAGQPTQPTTAQSPLLVPVMQATPSAPSQSVAPQQTPLAPPQPAQVQQLPEGVRRAMERLSKEDPVRVLFDLIRDGAHGEQNYRLLADARGLTREQRLVEMAQLWDYQPLDMLKRLSPQDPFYTWSTVYVAEICQNNADLFLVTLRDTFGHLEETQPWRGKHPGYVARALNHMFELHSGSQSKHARPEFIGLAMRRHCTYVPWIASSLRLPHDTGWGLNGEGTRIHLLVRLKQVASEHMLKLWLRMPAPNQEIDQQAAKELLQWSEERGVDLELALHTVAVRPSSQPELGPWRDRLNLLKTLVIDKVKNPTTMQLLQLTLNRLLEVPAST